MYMPQHLSQQFLASFNQSFKKVGHMRIFKKVQIVNKKTLLYYVLCTWHIIWPKLVLSTLLIRLHIHKFLVSSSWKHLFNHSKLKIFHSITFNFQKASHWLPTILHPTRLSVWQILNWFYIVKSLNHMLLPFRFGNHTLIINRAFFMLLVFNASIQNTIIKIDALKF